MALHDTSVEIATTFDDAPVPVLAVLDSFLRSQVHEAIAHDSHAESGTTFKEVSGKIVSGIPFPLPPLAEQHRIVTKVDELMVICDRLETARTERERTRNRLATASLARLNAPDPDPTTFQNHAAFALENLTPLTTRPDQINALRQTILNLAIRGKLVPQDPSDEPATELLLRIALEMGPRTRMTNPTTQLNSSIPENDLPQGWVIATVQSVCTSITDGDHLPPPKTQSGVPFLVIGDIRSQTIKFAGSRFVSPEYYNALDPIRRPRSGDLLYTLVGSYGIPVVVRSAQHFCVQRHIGILRPSTLIDVDFLARAMESRLVFDQATACATGIAQNGWVRPATWDTDMWAALWCVCNRHQTLFQRITAPSPLLWRPHVTNCHQVSSGAIFAKYTNSIVSITYTHFLMSV